MTTFVYVILSILLLGVVVMLHELGHFAVGRLCGFGIDEFSIGFGPKLLGWRRKEIDYSLRVLPIGGYVRFRGEDEDNASPDAFNNQPVWKRFLVTAAGAGMNFVLAFVAILLFFSLYGYTGAELPAIYSVQEGSPAQTAGLLPGDRVISVDGVEISYDKAGFDAMYAMFSARQDAQPMVIGIERGGEVLSVSVSKVQDADGKWLMGVTLGANVRVGFGTALRASWQSFKSMSTMMIDMLRNLIFKGEGAEQVSGAVGIVSQMSSYIQQGFDMVLSILATISLNLGIMNLLPLPALDGGRLVFLLIEGIFRKPVPREKEGMVHLIGMVLLFILMGVLVFSDVMKIVQG
jgi:regulator of sigma E protease